MTGQTNVAYASDEIKVIIESSLPETVDIDTICVIYPTPSLVRETKIMQGRDLGGSWRITVNSATGYTTKYPVGVAIRSGFVTTTWSPATSYLGTSSGWVRLGTPLIMNQIPAKALIDITGTAQGDGYVAERINNQMVFRFQADSSWTKLTVKTINLKCHETNDSTNPYLVNAQFDTSYSKNEGYGTAGVYSFDLTNPYPQYLQLSGLTLSADIYSSSATDTIFKISDMWVI